MSREFRATLHEVKGDVKRCKVRVIRVVYERTASLSVLYLKAHGYRLQHGHTLCELLWRNAEIKCCGSTSDTVFYRSLIAKWDVKSAILSFITIRDLSSIDCLYKESHLFVALRPGYLLTLILHTAYTAAYDVIVRTIYHRLSIVHQFEFLHTFLFHRTEILLMGRT